MPILTLWVRVYSGRLPLQQNFRRWLLVVGCRPALHLHVRFFHVGAHWGGCVHRCVCAYVSTSKKRPEVNVRCLLQLLPVYHSFVRSFLRLLRWSLTEPEAHQFAQANYQWSPEATFPCLASAVTTGMYHSSWVLHGCWGPKSGRCSSVWDKCFTARVSPLNLIPWIKIKKYNLSSLCLV